MFEVNENMVVYAFRYALGRMSGVSSDVSDYIIDNWHKFKPHTKKQIIREIEIAIERGEAGMELDVDFWKRIILLDKAGAKKVGDGK